MKLASIILPIILMGTPVFAESDCPHVYKPIPPPAKVVPPKTHKTPPTKVINQPPKDPPPCRCNSVQGPPGPRGPKGDDGVSTIVIHHEQIESKAAVRLGVMGAAFAPHGDWAWGPALQLQLPVSNKTDLVVSAGLADIITSGRQRGYLVEATINRNVYHRFGLGIGLHDVSIDGTQNNGYVDGHYLSATAGLTYSTKHVRLELGPTIGGLRDDSESGTQFQVGAQGSVFIGGAL